MITAALPNLPQALRRQYDAVQIGIDDGRRISPEQRRKAYALIREIADWMGEYPDEVKSFFKMDFILNRLRQMERQMFSLSDCSVTTAREFISFLIDFILSHDVPSRVPLYELTDDSGAYVYACLLKKKCCVCGRAAQIHHCTGSRIGMGNDRREVEHIGRMALPLCAEHHTEIHGKPEEEFFERYHLRPVAIDTAITKAYRLKRREANEVHRADESLL